jgi:hypothetical protein
LTYYFHLGTQELIKENIVLKDRIKMLEDKIVILENKNPLNNTVNNNLILEERVRKLEDFIINKFGVFL